MKMFPLKEFLKSLFKDHQACNLKFLFKNSRKHDVIKEILSHEFKYCSIFTGWNDGTYVYDQKFSNMINKCQLFFLFNLKLAKYYVTCETHVRADVKMNKGAVFFRLLVQERTLLNSKIHITQGTWLSC